MWKILPLNLCVKWLQSISCGKFSISCTRTRLNNCKINKKDKIKCIDLDALDEPLDAKCKVRIEPKIHYLDAILDFFEFEEKKNMTAATAASAVFYTASPSPFLVTTAPAARIVATDLECTTNPQYVTDPLTQTVVSKASLLPSCFCHEKRYKYH